MDEFRQNLAASVLPRLASEHVVVLPPGGLHSPDAPIRIAEQVWLQIGGHARPSSPTSLKETGEHSTPASPASRRPPPRPMPCGSMLEARGLVKTYRRRSVVNDVALRLQQGEIVGLLGPNGAGKTTTFYMIVGLIQPLAGQILLDGVDITEHAHVPAGAEGDRLPLPGAVDLPQTVRRGQHRGDPRDPAAQRERAATPARDAAGRVEHQAPAAQQGVPALRRRAPAPRDHAGARDASRNS